MKRKRPDLKSNDKIGKKRDFLFSEKSLRQLRKVNAGGGGGDCGPKIKNMVESEV